MTTLRFLEPAYLWLLAVPAVLFVGWFWLFGKRRREIRQLREQRIVPVRERFPMAGGLSFWFMLIVASALLVCALARPQVLLSVTQTAGVDFVVLQDGSASMRVDDVAPDRWQRSVRWLRTFAEVLSWRDERVALALFAHRAAPQVRLTRDPNALFFFLDYLDKESPFQIRDDTSWDTNIEDGIYWGVKMIDKDEELYGRRASAKAFVVLSDGQSWSGEVDRALIMAQDRNIRVYVIGVGTAEGGCIPQPPPRRYQEPEPPVYSSLDRQSLRAIAQAGGGAYYELGSESDDAIALNILADIQQASTGVLQRQEEFAELYWYLLVAAFLIMTAAVVLVRDWTQLGWQLSTASVLLWFLLV